MLNRKGFTLIELLVVVTIIVLLLAMLLPAMEKAIYQEAELAACAARLDGIAGGTSTYAVAHNSYPVPQYLALPLAE